jgi:hypothetical protein
VFNDCNIQSLYPLFHLPNFFCEEASLDFYIGALCGVEATPQYDHNTCCVLVLERFAGLHQDIEGDL